VALEDPVLLKMAAARLQDMADLEKIRARSDSLGIDWAYVEVWRSRLDLR